MSDDEFEVFISGFVGTTASISKEEWEKMSDSEKRAWAKRRLVESGTVHDVSHLDPHHPDKREVTF